MNINLKLLHTFLSVAEHCSFRRAAEETNHSQSAVSAQIRQLELQLGVRLFHRTTRHVQLSREGRLLLDCARNSIASIEQGLKQIRDDVDRQRGRLSFACAPTVAASRLPGILAAFQVSHPGLTAHVRELPSAEMHEAIRNQEVDFGVGARIPNAPEFSFRPILIDEICALVPHTMYLGDRDEVSLVELCEFPALVVAGSSALYGTLGEAQQSLGITLDVKYEVRQVQTQIAMAAEGLGIAILPRIALPSPPDPRLQVMKIVDPPLSRELCLVTLHGQQLSPAGARFVPFLQRMLRQPAVDGASTRPASSPDLKVIEGGNTEKAGRPRR